MSGTVKHIEAIVTMAEREVSRAISPERSGVYFALLEQALPYLRNLLGHERECDERLRRLQSHLKVAEMSCGERSDPASNQDNDADVRRLRSEIEDLRKRVIA
ncbi:MAG: hypothetical protein EBZ43_10480 [Betaproteobacteria bacterium]|nr:hypothetical protein [Betaproteobacteria bacterium]